jgi:hypothetical protein
MEEPFKFFLEATSRRSISECYKSISS